MVSNHCFDSITKIKENIFLFQTYELVDKHIRRLDADLAKFESEMKEKGRLSQTETEEEEEEIEEKPKKGKKKNAKDTKKKKAGALKDEDKKLKRKKGAEAKVDLGLGAASSLLAAVPQEIIDMPVDPNEPTYCLCQQVSYGEMIGCDNPDCPIEWFHFGCMNLTTKPKGKWYCQKCTPLFKKKK